MVNEQEVNIHLPSVEQLGFVVQDLDEAIKYYSSNFGWGPFRVQEYELKGFSFRGRTGNCRLKCAFCQSGPLEIELIQVLEGETPHSEFLREKGEGLQHLRFNVKDIDVLLAELAKVGIKPIFQKEFSQGAFAYIENKIGGIQFEFIDNKERSISK